MSIENMGNNPKQEQEQEQDEYMGDIIDRSMKNLGALRVLTDILKQKGPEIYNEVVPKLGRGAEIWIKFKECNGDLNALIEKYGQ